MAVYTLCCNCSTSFHGLLRLEIMNSILSTLLALPFSVVEIQLFFPDLSTTSGEKTLKNLGISENEVNSRTANSNCFVMFNQCSQVLALQRLFPSTNKDLTDSQIHKKDMHDKAEFTAMCQTISSQYFNTSFCTISHHIILPTALQYQEFYYPWF